jgi:hypothetical protein
MKKRKQNLNKHQNNNKKEEEKKRSEENIRKKIRRNRNARSWLGSDEYRRPVNQSSLLLSISH